MKETLSSMVDKIIEKMTDEEIKTAAKFGIIMISLGASKRIIKTIEEELKNDKKE